MADLTVEAIAKVRHENRQKINDSQPFLQMKVTDLRAELKARSLLATGNKSELVERLQLFVMTAQEDANSATEAAPAVAAGSPPPVAKAALKRDAPAAVQRQVTKTLIITLHMCLANSTIIH